MPDEREGRSEGFAIQRLSGAIGAEIRDIDLSRDLSPATVAALRRALLDHLVIVFRGQHLTPDRFLAVATAFGTPADYPFLHGIEGHPKIIRVAKLEHERVNFGGIWHTDTAYLDCPPMGTMLLAEEVPPQGGDTLFANQYLAYETLSPGLRRMLDSLQAEHSSAKAAVAATRADRIAEAGRDARAEFVATHPVVRIHPETGRRALYVNIAHTRRFAEMTEAESAPLLDYLFRHQVAPEFTCRLSWRPGTLAFWDNRAVLHYPVNDYHGHRRTALRITLAGERPQ
ncbi:TauD/TfdA dioxygenase family protein [Marinibaculum pumilum]|uniref:TauD/TfdA dioxygenase family protein n=1 Tax=Marinibaculum pumilum TaxID=1766165 RepID=A0ABV7L1Q9_9PROT